MTDSEYIYTQGMVEQMIEEARLEERRSRVKWAAICDAEEIWGTDIIVLSEWGMHLHVKDGRYIYVDGGASTCNVGRLRNLVTFVAALEPGEVIEEPEPEVEFKVGDAVREVAEAVVWVRGDSGLWTSAVYPATWGDPVVRFLVESGKLEYIILNGKVV